MDLENLCHQVVAIAKEAGAFLVQESKNFETKHIQTKGRNDFVSYVDQEAEKMIVQRLMEIFPDAGFIAEEGTGEKKENGYNWIVDPLDGTTNFVHNIPFYAVSIALADAHNNPLIGVVYEPNRDECFYAWLGGGAYMNENKIRVSPATSLSKGLLATGFPYADFKRVRQYVRSLRELMQKCHGLRRIGSAALDLAYVACGRFEAFFEYNLKPWDVAAGVLIVREAKGLATTFTGTDNCIFGREMIAASGIHHEVLEIVHRHFYGEEDASHTKLVS